MAAAESAAVNITPLSFSDIPGLLEDDRRVLSAVTEPCEVLSHSGRLVGLRFPRKLSESRLSEISEWKTAWHGTKLGNLASIMQYGLRPPSTSLPNGKVIIVPQNHTQLGKEHNGVKNWADAIFLAPSIAYAANPLFTKSVKFAGIEWLCVLNVKVNPTTIEPFQESTLKGYAPYAGEPDVKKYRVPSRRASIDAGRLTVRCLSPVASPLETKATHLAPLSKRRSISASSVPGSSTLTSTLMNRGAAAHAAKKNRIETKATESDAETSTTAGSLKDCEVNSFLESPSTTRGVGDVDTSDEDGENRNVGYCFRVEGTRASLFLRSVPSNDCDEADMFRMEDYPDVSVTSALLVSKEFIAESVNIMTYEEAERFFERHL